MSLKSILNFIVDVILLGVAFVITDLLMATMISSKSLLVEFFVYTIVYLVLFGAFKLICFIFFRRD